MPLGEGGPSGAESSTERLVPCPACGFHNLREQNFCGNCGKQLPAAAAPVGPDLPSMQESAAQEPASAESAGPLTHPEPSGPAEPEGEFESLSTLDEFALISVELMNYVQLASAVDDPAMARAFLDDCISGIEERVTVANGVVESVRNNILFLSFPREKSLRNSVDEAIRLSLELLEKPVHFNGMPVKIRIGIDIENAHERKPMTSATERSVATPGSAVVSERIYQFIEKRYNVEPIGPLRVGERMVTYYRLLKPKKAVVPQLDILSDDHEAVAGGPLPEESSLGTPVEVMPDYFGPEAPPEASDEEWDAASQEGSDETQWGGTAAPAPPISPVVPGVDPELMQSIGIDPALLVDVPDLSRVNVAGGMMPQVPGAPRMPVPEIPEAGQPETPRRDDTLRTPSGYCPPLYKTVRTPRSPNTTYEKAVHALAAELKGFIGDEGAGGCIVSLCATDGMGKSYITNNLLLKELIPDPRNPGVIWFAGHNYHCYGSKQLPLFLFYEMFHNSLPIMLEGADAKEIRNWVSQTMNQVYEGSASEALIDFFCDFLSVNPLEPVSVQTLDRMGNVEEYFVDFIGRMARRMPMLMVIEDLDQADVATLDLLVRLIEKGLLKHRICLMLTYARDFHPEGRLAQILSMNPHKEFVLADLTREEIERFLSSGPFAGTLDTLSAAHIENLLTYSKGRTIYLMEAVAYLQVKGVFLVDQETGRLYPNPEVDQGALMLPASLQEMIAYRLDLLTDDQRYVLQVASVLGERFTLRVLVDLCQYETDTIKEILEYLTVQQFIVSDFALTGQFRHRVIWDLVYHRMDPAVREDLHKLASEYLEDLSRKQITVNPGLIAYHAELGGMPNRAFQYWNMAGVWAAQLGAPVGMNMALSHALGLIEGRDDDEAAELRARLRENLGVLNIDDDPEFSVTLLEEAVAFYRERQNSARMIEGLGYLASGYEELGSLQKALENLDQSLQLISRTQYPQEYALMQVNKLEYLYKLGRYQKALDLMESEIEPVFAGNSHDPVFVGAWLNARRLKADMLLSQCRIEAFDIINQALTEAQEHQLDELIIGLKMARTRGFFLKGNYESGERNLYNVLEQIESYPHNELFMGRWGLLAICHHVEMGDWKNANELILHSIYQSEKARDFGTWIMINTYAGYLALMDGRPRDARHIVEAMATESSERRLAACALLCWRFLTEIYHAEGDLDQALDVVSKAYEIAAKDEVRNGLETFRLGLAKARIQLAAGQLKEAGTLLQNQWPRIKQTGFLPLIADNAAAIGELYKTLAAHAPDAVKQAKHTDRSLEFFDISYNQWKQLKNTYRMSLVAEQMPGD